MSMILQELLDKFEVDYSKFPKGILNIIVNEDINNFTNVNQDNDDKIIFSGKYYDGDDSNKTLVKSTIEIDLTGMTYEEIGIYEQAVSLQDSNPKTYGLETEEGLLEILKKGLSKDFVSVIKNVENCYTDFRTYNIFGGISKQG